MKKYLTIIIMAGLMTTVAMAQQQNAATSGERQDNSIPGQYRREKATVTYKVDHKTAKGRRVATRRGNGELKKKNDSKAVNEYRKALKADSIYAKAQYNRALAHGRLGQNDTAIAYYQKAYQNSSATKELREKAHYNAGNIHLRQALAARDTGGYDAQSLQLAIEEYKSALRLDSKNADAKHNLSLAKQLLRPENQNGGGQQQNNQNQQNQDQQNKDQQNQNQQNQDQQNKDQQNQNQQNQDQQNQQNRQNPQDKKQQEQRRREAEQMLNAMKNNEQQTMKAIRMKEAAKERRQGSPTKIEKDW